MSEQTREKIIETLRGEALGDPETGWLSDLSRRGLTWDERDEVIAVGEWCGSVDVGHLAGIVESIISKHTEERTARLEQAEQAVARVRVLHRPVDVEPSDTICDGCSTLRGTGENMRYFPVEEWPCETIRALDGEQE